jgi:CheY-like chemotaxis protein
MNVLVIEDDLDYAKYLQKLFQSQGIRVFHSTNSLDAIEILKEMNIDLILSDIILPKKGGLELAIALNHRYPIYLMTGMYKGPLFIDMKVYADAVFFKDEINKKLIQKIARSFRVEAA